MITVPPGTEDGHAGAPQGSGRQRAGRPGRAVPDRAGPVLPARGPRRVCVVPINLAQALLGSRIKVKTLDGKRVVLRIPPGTQHGQKFRIAGQGIEKNGRRGDQYVEVKLELPEKLTPEQEAARSSRKRRA